MKLNIQKTSSTPIVRFIEENKILEIIGDSYPENSFEFYKPVIEWIKEYTMGDNGLTLIVNLVYFNSSTSKVLYDLFDLFNDLKSDNKNVSIEWHYHEDNELSLEAGEEYADDYDDIDIKLVTV